MMELKYESDEGDYAVGNCCAIASLQEFPCDPLDPKEEYSVRKALEEGEGAAIRNGKSILFVTLNTDQRMVEALLIEAGFSSSHSEWAYRNPKYATNRRGVKMYSKLLYKPD
jgi:hypothetical protein